MTFSREGVRDPIRTKDPIPAISSILSIIAAFVAGTFAIVFTYRLGISGNHYGNELFGDMVILTSVLWVSTAAFLSIGTRPPILPKPPTPKEEPE